MMLPTIVSILVALCLLGLGQSSEVAVVGGRELQGSEGGLAHIALSVGRKSVEETLTGEVSDTLFDIFGGKKSLKKKVKRHIRSPLASLNKNDSPTLEVDWSEDELVITVNQPADLTRRREPMPATISGTLELPMENGGESSALFWDFKLTFTLDIYATNSKKPGILVKVDGSIMHTETPNGEAEAATNALLISNELDVIWSKAGETREAFGDPMQSVQHGDPDADYVTMNRLEIDCCTRGGSRGASGFEFELRVKHRESAALRLNKPCFLQGLACGDPHLSTWTGHRYDYHGECDMVLLSAPLFQGGPLNIHIRTKIRHGYSFIETAAIRIGNNTLEVAGWGDYVFDGVNRADLSAASLSTYAVNHTQVNKKHHTFDIAINDDEYIQLSTYKDWVAVKIMGAPNHTFQGSLGLLGDYVSGEMVARDGQTVIDDPNAFGQEWQVLPWEPQLFTGFREPQSPSLCVLPDNAAEQALRRHLGETIPRGAAEEACAKFHSDKIDMESCIFDVMASGDIEMAQASVEY